MRRTAALFVVVAACSSAAPLRLGPPLHSPPPDPPGAPPDPATWGQLVHEVDDLVFEGGHVHFEMRWSDGHVIQTARNDYLIPVTIAWKVSDLDNLDPDSPTSGIAVLPGSVAVGSTGPTEVLATFHLAVTSQRFSRTLDFHAQFGDPDARPIDYAYAIPFAAGDQHRIIQGFGGTFSHTGGDFYSLDFECAEGTAVVAARDGVVVAVNREAEGHGTSDDFASYARTNFVLVAHQDGTLGKYQHLAHGGVDVRPGQTVARGQYLGRSGNTGFSTTPHLHFEVMTAAPDGLGAQSFPFRLEVAPRINEDPVEGRSYRAWESSP